MKTRINGGRKFNVKTITLKVSDLSDDTRYQQRWDDDPYWRAASITQSVKASGAEKFRDNPLVVKINGVYYLVDGFGRKQTAIQLKREFIEVDLVCTKHPREDAEWISLTANLGHVSEKAPSGKEAAVIAHKLFHEHHLPVPQIAAICGCSKETVARRLSKAPTIIRDHQNAESPEALGVFSGRPAAEGTAKKALMALFPRDLDGCTSFDAVAARLLDKCNVTLLVLVGNNEKQIYRLEHVAFFNGRTETASNFLVLLYNGTHGSSTADARRRIVEVKENTDHYLPGLCTFHVEDLSTRIAAFNGTNVLRYIKSCRKSAVTA